MKRPPNKIPDKLPDWLHKKNFNLIEVQGMRARSQSGLWICPCGNYTLNFGRCETCKSEGSLNEEYSYDPELDRW